MQQQIQQQIGHLHGTVRFQAPKMSPEPLNLTVPWGLLTTNATTNRQPARHGAISMPKNDNKSCFSFLNLPVPWGLLATNATTNRQSARHGAISMLENATKYQSPARLGEISGCESESDPGLQRGPGRPRPQNCQI